jgi:hypothetical protein
LLRPLGEPATAASGPSNLKLRTRETYALKFGADDLKAMSAAYILYIYIYIHTHTHIDLKAVSTGYMLQSIAQP